MAEAERRRLRSAIVDLEGSLADAEAEHLSGELDTDSFTAIGQRDRERLAELVAELASLGDEDPPSLYVPEHPAEVVSVGPGRARLARVVVWIVLGLVLVGLVAGIVVVVARSAAPSRSQQVSALLVRADALEAQGRLSEALPLYGQVLAIEPRQPNALAQSGWITFTAGRQAGSTALMASGENLVRDALGADPTLAAGHLYLGVIDLLGAQDPQAALTQFQAFLDLKPSAYWRRVAAPYITQAADLAGVAVPAGVG